MWKRNSKKRNDDLVESEDDCRSHASKHGWSRYVVQSNAHATHSALIPPGAALVTRNLSRGGDLSVMTPARQVGGYNIWSAIVVYVANDTFMHTGCSRRRRSPSHCSTVQTFCLKGVVRKWSKTNFKLFFPITWRWRIPWEQAWPCPSIGSSVSYFAGRPWPVG